MTDDATSQLLGRFIGSVQPVVPLVSVWAHGSLAAGDYQPGRSDLDLIAILDRPCTAAEQQHLGEVHESLGGAFALASKLHCSYCAAGELDDPAHLHLTWAHEEFMHRRVTPVTRRELHDFGLVLYGEAPAALLPPVTGEQLAEFVVQDLKGFWLPSLDHPERWGRDIWVDLGLLTLARATVTLRDGKLITKAEALCVLTELGAPAEVVDDIRQRRYGDPGPASQQWIARRAQLTLTFLRPAIEQLVAQWPPSTGCDRRPAAMTEETVSATTTIGASAEAVFAVLADPSRHAAMDGTGRVRDSLDGQRLTGSGQIFRVVMYHENHPDGSYEMANRVIAFEPPHVISWQPGYVSAETGQLEFGGWIWRYDLTQLGPDETRVTLSYDWSAVGPVPRQRIQFPPFPPDHLDDSLSHLAAIVAR